LDETSQAAFFILAATAQVFLWQDGSKTEEASQQDEPPACLR
jgi:hypothetical protein